MRFIEYHGYVDIKRVCRYKIIRLRKKDSSEQIGREKNT